MIKLQHKFKVIEIETKSDITLDKLIKRYNTNLGLGLNSYIVSKYIDGEFVSKANLNDVVEDNAVYVIEMELDAKGNI